MSVSKTDNPIVVVFGYDCRGQVVVLCVVEHYGEKSLTDLSQSVANC